VRLIRFLAGDGGPRIGVLDAGGDATVLGAAAGSLAELLALPVAEIRGICEAPAGETVPAAEIALLAPADGRMEVWAAGVTYERSRTARMAESEQSADIYDRVYAAERPELFFKSAAWRVSGPGAPVSVRADSPSTFPSPSWRWCSTPRARSRATPSATT
jgi:2-dehydro-3-deoxy-D-arabinonate dehydratase